MWAKIRNNRLIKHSFIFAIGTTGANGFNYLYQLLMGRFLGPSDYGIFASLFSLLYIISVPSATVLMVATKFTSGFKAQNYWGKIHSLFLDLTKRLAVIGISAFFVFLVLSKVVASFLKISETMPVILLGGVFVVATLAPVNRGIMQGLEDFTQLSLIGALESVLKVILALALVFVGLTVNKALGVVLIAMAVGYALTYYPLRKVLASPEDKEEINFGEVVRSSLFIFAALFFVTFLYNADIIFVKHFFEAREAGLYSGLALMGKVIFFATMAVSGVMFPMVAGAHKTNQKYDHLLGQTLLIVFSVSFLVVLLYFFLPEIMIKAFFIGSRDYLPIAPYLGYFGATMLALSLVNVFIYYFLAIHQKSFLFFLAGAALLEGILLWWFHDSITQVIQVLFSSIFLLLLGLVFCYYSKKYYWFNNSARKIIVTESNGE